MDKIDRLGWAAGISLTSYGVRVGVRVNDPQALEDLINRFPPGWKQSRSPVVERLYSLFVGGHSSRPHVRRFNLLYAGAERLARTTSLEASLETFESDLQFYIAEAARRRVFVHAGVVGWQGRAIIIPGRSFSGKTSLVAALVRAGAIYYSDEYAVLDGQGRVYPYPKPLSLRIKPTGEQTKTPVEALGGQAGTKPLPIGLVLVSQYKEGARWRPRQLSPGQGALALLAHTISARRQPGTALATFQQFIADVPVLKSVRGEASEAAESILHRLGV